MRPPDRSQTSAGRHWCGKARNHHTTLPKHGENKNWTPDENTQTLPFDNGRECTVDGSEAIGSASVGVDSVCRPSNKIRRASQRIQHAEFVHEFAALQDTKRVCKSSSEKMVYRPSNWKQHYLLCTRQQLLHTDRPEAEWIANGRQRPSQGMSRLPSRFLHARPSINHGHKHTTSCATERIPCVRCRPSDLMVASQRCTSSATSGFRKLIIAVGRGSKPDV
jgi:hypothetical protein